jgi:hypothetical protein
MRDNQSDAITYSLFFIGSSRRIGSKNIFQLYENPETLFANAIQGAHKLILI